MRVGDDLPALGVGRLGEASFVDQEGRLLLGLRDDPLRLFLGLLDDPLALGVDALRRPDLFGDGDAELVDQAEGGVLVDDDVGGEGQLLAVRDQRFEALDEEDDVQRSALQAVVGPGRSAGRKYRTGRVDSGLDVRAVQSSSTAASTAARAAAGTMVDTSPPNDAISFTRLELT